MRYRLNLVTFAVLATWGAGSFSVPSVAFAGKLSDARSAVKSGGSKSNSSSRSSSSSDNSGRSSGGMGASIHPGWNGYDPFYDNWLTWLMFPWWGPRRILGDSTSRTCAFPDAPYADGADGYVRISGRTPAARLPEAPATSSEGDKLLGRGTALRVWAEGAAQSEQLFGGSVGFLWSGYHRLELQGEFRGYRESDAGTTDTLLLGSLGVNYIFAQSEGVQVRSGAGVRWMPDPEGTLAGAYFSYGADFYPASPIIVSVSGDVGGINGAATAAVRATLGAIFDRVEIYGGFEGFWIDDIDLSTAVFGARLWQ